MKRISFIYLALLFLFVCIVLYVYHATPFFQEQHFEGMIAYNESASTLNQVIIPQYSNQPVYKIHDSLYFDNMNGNVLELFGTTFNGSNVDMTGDSLTNITIMSRSPTRLPSSDLFQATTQNIDVTNSEGKIMVSSGLVPNNTTNSYNTQWVYPTNLDMVAISNQSIIPNYQVFYFPWGQDTIVHVYDFTQSTNIGTYCFRNNGGDPIHVASNCNLPIPTTYKGDADTSHTNTYRTLSAYENGSRFVFQLADNIFYDTSNRYLLIKNSQGQYTIYDGNSDSNGAVRVQTNVASVSNTPKTFSYQPFHALYMSDTDGGNLVLYIPVSATQTLVCVLCVDSTNTQLLSIRNVVRFNTASSNGVDGMSNVTIPSSVDTTTSTSATTSTSSSSSISSTGATGATGTNGTNGTNGTDSSTSSSSFTIPDDFYQNYFMMNFLNASAPYGRVSEDYVLKTQVLSPICPSCPACPNLTCPSNNTVCTTCGGHGGNGTYGIDICYNNGLGIANGINNIGNSTVGVVNNLANKTVGLGERIGNDLMYGANGVLNTAERIGGKVFDGVEDVAGDVWGEVKGVGRGLKDSLGYRPTQVGSGGHTGGYTGPVSLSNINFQPVQQVGGGNNNGNYGVIVPSYPSGGAGAPYGNADSRNPSSSTNYLPLTSDFSRFGR